MLTTHPHLVPRSWMSRSYTSSPPPQAPPWRVKGLLYFTLYQEKIPARNAINAHAQDFAASDELLLAILKAFIPQPLNKQRTSGFSCVLMNSVWFNVEHYHNTHSTQYRCTHYTLLLTAWCFQSVCNSVTPWCVILFYTNSSPLVHLPVHIPPAPHQSRHPPAGTFS
jgi:hypothetical protein